MKQWPLIATISILPVAPTSVPLPLGTTCTEDRGLFQCPGSDVGTSKEASKEACARRCYDNPACESWLYERPNIATNPNQYTDCKLKGAARCTRRQNTDNTGCTWVWGSRHCGKGSKPTTLKGQGWEDGRSVGLGYLWFEKDAHLTHSEAVKFCEKKHGHLIEIDSQAQLDYVVNTLKIISKNVRVFPLGFSHAKGWWGGATDEDKEGTWLWEESGAPVQSFVWGTNPQQPNSHGDEDNFCFLDWTGFKGNDVAGTHKMYPLCQYKEEWEDGRNGGEVSNFCRCPILCLNISISIKLLNFSCWP